MSSSTPANVSSTCQTFIANAVAQENGSANAVQLLKNVGGLSTITQAREEIEKYYIKNFNQIKGFFLATYTESNSHKIISTILNELELSDISKQPQNSILEVTIAAICSVEQSLTSDDMRLILSNTDSENLYSISLNQSDKLSQPASATKGKITPASQQQQQQQPQQQQQQQQAKQSSVLTNPSNKSAAAATATTSSSSLNSSATTTSKVNNTPLGMGVSKVPPVATGLAARRKLQIEDSDDQEEELEVPSQSKKLKNSSPHMDVEEQKQPQTNKNASSTAMHDEDSSDDELFIANHLKTQAAKKEAQQSAAAGNLIKSNPPSSVASAQAKSTPLSASKSKAKPAPATGVPKITSFFKKA